MKANLANLRARLGAHGLPMPRVDDGGRYLPGEPCLIWRGSHNGARKPQGQLTVRDGGEHRKLYVHRLALWLKENPRARVDRHGCVKLPDPLPLAVQSCGNSLCIEPSHLKRKT